MLLTLEALNAEEGDCLLLHHGSTKDPRHILIDGGPASTYFNSLKPRLEELRKLHRLSASKSLPIELVVLSHTDEDHLDGLVQLFNELRKAREQSRPAPYRAESIWYNCFDDVIHNKEVAAIQSLANSPNPEIRALVAGVPGGRVLRDDADYLVVPINQDFDTFAMRKAKKAPLIPFDDLSLTVLSPSATELQSIEKAWDKYLQEHSLGDEGGVASTTKDSSVTNLSSIALLAEAGDKRLLLTGDARADQLLAGLKAAGKLSPAAPFVVDVFKLPHHGSCRNSTLELFQKVHASHYVISANGKDGNPDESVLEMLWTARGAGTWTVWTTFPKNAAKLIDATSKTDAKRVKALTDVQAWFDSHKVKVCYRKPKDLSIKIHLGDEKID